jgi:uncharacterized membrane protein YhhN
VTTTAWALITVAALLAAADWLAVARRSRMLEYFAKPGTLAALLAVALVLHPERSDVRAWFVVALAFSLAGDVFLMLPSDLFVPGLASFLLAHLAYTVGFDLHAGSAVALVATCLLVAAAGAAIGSRVVARVAHGDHPSLVVPVVAYMVVISAMVASALAAGPVLGAVGAVLFYASDALIAWNRFVQPRPWMPLAIIVTYHVGQAALVLSLAS